MTRRAHTAQDEEPPSGVPLRTHSVANPAAVAPDLDPAYYPLLTGGCTRERASPRPLPPPADRADGHQDLCWPSRRGNRLYHCDGRITDLAGHALPPQARTRAGDRP